MQARTNPYNRSPLSITQVDPNGNVLQTYVFLGTVPRAVFDAARRGAKAASPKDPGTPIWSASDAKILENYYGSKWLVGLAGPGRVEEMTTSSESRSEKSESRSEKSETRPGPARATRAKAIVFTDIAVYPEDTVYDLRLKLCAVSGVPIWRAHLFYYVGLGETSSNSEEGPLLPYKITLDGIPVPVDWRQIRAPFDARESVAGLAIDKSLEERRDSIRVEAFDTYTPLIPLAATGISLARIVRAYYVDIASVLPINQLSDGRTQFSSTIVDRAQLSAAIRDRYQFDLLYYGALLKYWPLLSPDACIKALSTDKNALAETYPDLAPDPEKLQDRFEIENELSDEALAWRPPAESKGGRNSIAVTVAALRVAPASARMRVTVRNVFDWIPLSREGILAARVQFDVENKFVLATKRHNSSYIGKTADAISAFIARQKDPSQRVAFVIKRDVKTKSQIEVATGQLSINTEGYYEAAAGWHEDDRIGFESIRDELLQMVSPIITTINEMGPSAFPIGGTLKHITKCGGTLGAITASVFWPKTLTTLDFKALREQLRIFERAGFITMRGVQQSGTYMFAFRRGIVSANSEEVPDSLLEGPISSSKSSQYENQYSWLTDNSQETNTSKIFPGRIVRITHRATDLRIEILQSDSLAEFELIRRYLFAFLDNHTETTLKPLKTSLSSRTRILRRLQERDPQLFDLKRYAGQVSVYSVLCQAGRQPNILNAAEAESLSQKQKALLVPYWNFTENAPAFYECPNAQYPHLSFRSGMHPLGYCLPCCKKARAAVGSRAAAVNKDCIARALNQKTDSGLDNSTSLQIRHILAYGKSIPLDRIGELPREILSGLFLEAGTSNGKCLLVGVQQSAPAVPAAGFAYSCALACGQICRQNCGQFCLQNCGNILRPNSELENEVMVAALEHIAKTAAALGEDFITIGTGAGALFESANSMADAIRSAFIRKDNDPSIFGPGGELEAFWPDLFIDLVRKSFGLEIVVMFDRLGTGSVLLEATSIGVENIINGKPFIMIMSSPSGVYPIALFAPPRRGHHSAMDFKFITHDGADSQATFANIISAAFGAKPKGIKVAPNAVLLKKFAAGSEWKIKTWMANLRGQVYGAIIQNGGANPHADLRANYAYIPLAYTATSADGIPVKFGALPQNDLPAEVLDAAVSMINDFITKGAEPFTLLAKREESSPIMLNNLIVGYTANLTESQLKNSQRVFYYHNGLTIQSDQSDPILFPYDPHEVDSAIVALRLNKESKDDQTASEKVVSLANLEIRQHQIYALLLSEFAALLTTERNVALRKEITTAIASTRFASAKSISTLRIRLSAILSSWPDDATAIRSALAKAYSSASGAESIGAAANAAINASTFSFDRLTLNRLSRLSTHAETVMEVRKLMEPRVRAVSDEMEMSMADNMFVSCSEQSSLPRNQCVAGKLAVPANDLSGFYDCLAADIRNPSKALLLSAASAGVLNPLEFIKRPDEHLQVVV